MTLPNDAPRFTILGPVGARVGERPVPLPGPGARCVLGVLLAESGREVPTESLIAACWDGDPPASARGAVHVRVSHLRRCLPGVIETGVRGYRAVLRAEQVDLHRFRALANAATSAAGPEERARAWEAALACWHGEPLAGLGSGWVADMIRGPLLEERWSAAEAHAGVLVDLGRYGDAVTGLRALLRAQPFREGAHTLLMRALHADGRRAEALRAFREARDAMVEELGIEPGPELTGLHARILREEPAGPRRNGPPGPGAQGPRAARPAAPVPRQLPGVSGTFIGRDDLIADLDAVHADCRGPGAGTGLALLCGLAGIGKTRLALHWAQHRADAFPDGQLFVNLHGDDPAQRADPTAVLHGFLRALDVDSARLPSDVDALAGLFRSAVAGRRVLVVLDNAHDDAQVRPLLPGAGCMAVVTSRHRLAGLVAREAGRRIAVPALAAREALRLLGDVLGEERVAREPRAAAELTELCAGLPLVLRMVADRIASVPGAGLRHVVRELRAERLDPGGSDAADGPGAGLRAVFSSSYRALPHDAARAFRLLGLLPAVPVTVSAVAALTGTDRARARRALDQSHARHLVEQPGWAVYELHDLLRVYAREEALRQDSEEDRHQAVLRVVDWYTTSAYEAMGLVVARARPLAPPRWTDAVPPAFPDRQAALAWCDANRPLLLALPGLAREHGLYQHAWYLPWVLFGYFSVRRLFDAWVGAGETALEAARATGDAGAEGRALNMLGPAYAETGRTAEAEAALRGAAELFRRAGDRYSEAAATCNLGELCACAGEYAEALIHFVRARVLYRAEEIAHKEAVALAGMGRAQVALGDRAAGIRHMLLAVEGLPHSPQTRAETLDHLAAALLAEGRRDRAIGALGQAAELYAHCEDWALEREARQRLGELHRAAGDDEAARRSFGRALELAVAQDRPEEERADLEAALTAVPAAPARSGPGGAGAAGRAVSG
ncbi:AfsR/SARP family transcriptional regulator [Streptomyces marincola]|uniref:AfsR/SARP family transcriptional regulator n=1 Tax=Streptomyces marincola TaxID=2878388 RepID=UPI001CF41F42|nr:BTAD domain-containing putative transcriptional regulator [Streptomyces marincola]UCM88186.1 hypothetical protein LC193_09585 [Streptomyces marincola]